MRSYANEDLSGEERGREQLMAKLLALDDSTFKAVSAKLDDFLAPGKADDIFPMSKLEELLDPKKVSAFLNAKNLDELLDVKKLNKMVDLERLSIVANWDKKDTRGLAVYSSKNFFVELKESSVHPEILRKAMQRQIDFSPNFIEGLESQYITYLTKPTWTIDRGSRQIPIQQFWR